MVYLLYGRTEHSIKCIAIKDDNHVSDFVVIDTKVKNPVSFLMHAN